MRSVHKSYTHCPTLASRKDLPKKDMACSTVFVKTLLPRNRVFAKDACLIDLHCDHEDKFGRTIGSVAHFSLGKIKEILQEGAPADG
jgi:hypothetical protein